MLALTRPDVALLRGRDHRRPRARAAEGRVRDAGAVGHVSDVSAPGVPRPATSSTLDRFQLQAIDALDAGQSVLVAAPTGSGKTVVAEYAVALALGRRRARPSTRRRSRRCRTRSSATSSAARPRAGRPAHRRQRHQRRRADRRDDHRGPAQHDLRRVAGAAPASGSSSLDEVHYLQDPYRGPVWEEVIIHLPRDGAARVPVGHRVERRGAGRLDHHGAGPDHRGHRGAAAGRARQPLPRGRPVGARPAPAADARRRPAQPRGEPARRRVAPRPGTSGAGPAGASPRPRRIEVVERLAAEDLLPAIYFIFSRAACDDAVRACSTPACGSPRPTSGSGSGRSSRSARRALSDGDLDVLGYDRWLAGARARHRRPPRRDGAAVQGGGRGLLRRGAGEGRCSPPRRSPSASTCRPARW